jgi:hypothetical protein
MEKINKSIKSTKLVVTAVEAAMVSAQLAGRIVLRGHVAC